MNKKFADLIAATFMFISITAAHGQTVSKIGFLGVRPDDSKNTFELFRQQLQVLGYIDGRNIAFEYRNAENKPNRLSLLVDELLKLRVDVLVVAAINEARAAKSATKAIPIVGLNLGDPVQSGLVESLAHPGGNLTGFTPIAGELGGKRLEVLKETVLKLTRVAVLWDPRSPSGENTWEEIQLPARTLGLQLHSMEVNAANKFESAFDEAAKSRSEALSVNLSPMINSNQRRIHELTAKHRLPAIYPRAEFVQSGGLMSYGADRQAGFKRAAVMVDKILKGTKPADIPVERPTKFEFIINLKTAKQIGLTIPPNVLARADRVIR